MRRGAGVPGIVLAVLLALAATVLAHGGGKPQLANAAVGPYLLSAWTNPDPAVAGQVHVTVSLALATSGEAVTEPVVAVTARPLEGGTAPMQAEATHTNATIPIFYEADIEAPTAGEWRFDLEVSGPEGAGAAGFTLMVEEPGPNWLLIGMAGVGVAAAAGAAWVLLSGGKRTPPGERRPGRGRRDAGPAPDREEPA